MQSVVHEILAGLKNLGSVSELRVSAAKGLRPQVRPRVNTHIHLPPNFSAFQSVEQAVDLCVAQEVRVVGVTNYYDYEVYGDFARLARHHAIFPLFGLEVIALIDDLVKKGVKINDPGNPGRIYLCGKGITRFAPMNPAAQRFIDTIRRNDAQRMVTMTDALAGIFERHGVSTGLNAPAIVDRVVRRHSADRDRVYLQERHLCQAFQERLFDLVPAADRERRLAAVLSAPSKAGGDPVKIQNEIRSHLMKAGKPAFAEERFLSFEDAYRLVLEMGGIPCYPTLADGTSPICPYEDPVESLIGRIHESNIHCAEFIPIRNSPEVLSHYVKAMRSAGIAVTAGTEHNTLDLLPIEPACLRNQPVPEDVKEIFWEGACVVAAHQFLTLHGECGFVDAAGRPNPAWSDPHQRIAAFASLGAAVIERYFQSSHGGARPER